MSHFLHLSRWVFASFVPHPCCPFWAERLLRFTYWKYDFMCMWCSSFLVFYPVGFDRFLLNLELGVWNFGGGIYFGGSVLYVEYPIRDRDQHLWKEYIVCIATSNFEMEDGRERVQQNRGVWRRSRLGVPLTSGGVGMVYWTNKGCSLQ